MHLGNTSTRKRILLPLADPRDQFAELRFRRRPPEQGVMVFDPVTGAVRLAVALARLDPSRPVVVEAESSKVGDCRVPPQLWKAMIAAPRVAIAAPLARQEKRDREATRVRPARSRIFIPSVLFGPDRALE